MFSELKLFPVKSTKGTIKARGRVTISDVIDVSFTVRKGKEGPWVCLPSHLGKDKDGDDKWYKDVYIKDETNRDNFNKAVLEKYKELEESESTSDESDDTVPF